MGILPGDSLLFTAGALASRGQALDLAVALPLTALAALCGDQINYAFGKMLGHKRLREGGFFLSAKRLERGRRFYLKYGAMTIVFGRFVPVVRSVVPLWAAVAGIGYRRFLPWSVLGACLWAGVFTMVGYVFGNLPLVRDHFLLVLLGVIVLSLSPAAVELLAVRFGHSRRRGLRPPLGGIA